MVISSRGDEVSDLSIFGMTSIGAADQVEWAHVLCDTLTTILMALVIFRQQRRVIVVDKAAEISRRKTSRVQISPAPPDGPDVGTSPKQNRNSTSSSDGERSPR